MFNVISKFLSYFWKFKIANKINKESKIKEPVEIVRKIEEFRLKKNELERVKNIDSIRYSNYIDALTWVIYADQKDY